MTPISYFTAVFGEPNRPGKDPVESGTYTPDPSFAPFSTEPGDIMLLYCTAKYSGFEKVVPGLGLVTGSNNQLVHYKYIPFKTPIPKSVLDTNLEPNDRVSFGRIHLPKYWLFKISRKSFSAIVAGYDISWP